MSSTFDNVISSRPFLKSLIIIFLILNLTVFIPLIIERMFRVFGHDRIWVLDGGLPRWLASGYNVESSASSDAILKASAASEAIEKVYQGQTVKHSSFLISISFFICNS